MSLLTIFRCQNRLFNMKNTMLTLELEVLSGPALLEGHDICHRLAPTARFIRYFLDILGGKSLYGETNLPFREIPNVVSFRSAIEVNFELVPVMTALIIEATWIST
jgi:hypothetical protein